MGERVAQRPFRHGAARLLSFEIGRFLHDRAGDPDAAGQERADEERDTPAPAVKRRRIEQACGQRADRDGQQRADLARCRGKRGDQSAPFGPRAFEQIGDHAAILAADGKPHDAAEQEEQPARQCSHLRVGRQDGGEKRRCRHERDRQQQHAPPPMAIADMAEDNRAERAHQIGDREPRQRRGERSRAVTEEHPRQHGGEIQIESEVIPFDDGRKGRHSHGSARDAALHLSGAGHLRFQAGRGPTV